MSKLRKPLVKKPSHMFDGESISKQLQNSSVGGFQKAMQDIKPLLPTVVFKLPTVIVMGGKSAGKSSLLENITKCPVFPRDPALCTKMPVKLQLVQAPSEQDCSVIVNWRGVSVSLDSKDDILAEVAKIMDSVDSIVTDEVTVTICQVDVPTLELVDLPGIQTFPEDSRKSTTNLVHNYLSKPDTLILCVVDATIPSLDSSIAMQMIRDANKLPNTILALTKSDLVRDENEIAERIFERILGSSPDNQHLVGLAGCVAVANRKHRDHVSLIEADVEERRHFQAILGDPAPAYAADEVQQRLRDNMTVKKLIVKLDSLFHDFIVLRWKPAALSCLDPLEQQSQDEIQKLGPAVDALSKDGVMEAIADQVDYEAICAALRMTVIQVTKNSQLYSLANHMSYHLWGTVSWAESMMKIEDKVSKAVHAALASDKYLKPVVDVFNAVFDKSTPLKLKRFSSLKQLLQSEILPARVAEAKEAAGVVIVDMLQKSMMQLNYDAPVDDLFQKLDSSIRGCIIKHMIYHLKNRPLSLPEAFVLAEDDRVKRKRAKLTDKLSKICTATDKISHIEDALSVNTDSDHSPHSSRVGQDVPDFLDFGEQVHGTDALSETAPAGFDFAREIGMFYDCKTGVDTILAPVISASVTAGSNELQMQPVPEMLVYSQGPEATNKLASNASTPVPVSVPVEVSDQHSDTAETPQAMANSGVDPDLSSSAVPAVHAVNDLPAGAAPVVEEAQMTNSNLASSMAQLSSLQLGSPRSAAEINAELENLPVSPAPSVPSSVIDGFTMIM